LLALFNATGVAELSVLRYPHRVDLLLIW